MPNPVEYAERVLEVHDIFVSTEQVLDEHARALDAMTSANRRIRDLEEDLRLAEIDTGIAAERAADAREWKGIGQRSKFVKDFITSYPEVVNLRGEIESAKNRRDEAEADVRHLALVIGARTARMNELGGLLNFYAAAKLVSQKESE
jgi:uncharacterized coiled-coil DUF342 family protein